eukprot:1326265-Amphidinium_carterae.1
MPLQCAEKTKIKGFLHRQFDIAIMLMFLKKLVLLHIVHATFVQQSAAYMQLVVHSSVHTTPQERRL